MIQVLNTLYFTNLHHHCLYYYQHHYPLQHLVLPILPARCQGNYRQGNHDHYDFHLLRSYGEFHSILQCWQLP